MGKPTIPLLVLKRIKEYTSRPVTEEPTKGLMGFIVGALNLACGSTEQRRLALGWLFTPDEQVMQPMSSKELSPAQVFALKKWIGPQLVRSDSGQESWTKRADFEIEAKWVLARASQAYQFVNWLMERYGRVVLMGELHLLEASETWWPALMERMDQNHEKFLDTFEVALDVVLHGKEVAPPADLQIGLPEPGFETELDSQADFLEFVNG